MPQSTDLSQMMVSVETKKADVTFLNGIVAKAIWMLTLENSGYFRRCSATCLFPRSDVCKGQYDLVKTIDLILSEMRSWRY